MTLVCDHAGGMRPIMWDIKCEAALEVPIPDRDWWPSSCSSGVMQSCTLLFGQRHRVMPEPRRRKGLAHLVVADPSRSCCLAYGLILVVLLA